MLYSFFLQQFVRLIEILFEFLLEPKEVSLHAILMELWMNH